ncbi:MAG: glycoside hydrolase family 31 protein [Chitinispirillaceae bacterium]
MYLLNKHMHPANFRFADRLVPEVTIDGTVGKLSCESCGDVYHIKVNGERWPSVEVIPPMKPLQKACCKERSSGTGLLFSETGEIVLQDKTGRAVLRSCPGQGFGISGRQWMFSFVREAGTQFYGLGERQSPFERSGRTYKFWNVDCWADHGHDRVANDFYDPDYISVPYLIIKRGNEYIGLLIESPFCSVISIDQKDVIAGQMEAQKGDDQPCIYLGAENGAPSLYILYGPTLAELTRKLQKLAGTLALPPLWALGYHQSRWGYQSDKDLFRLAHNFEKHGHPVDGLWLDIGYMDNYKVFTFDKQKVPDPGAMVKDLGARGYHVVPILDPGVKKDDDYEIYREGKAADVFCKNRAGTDFVGLVWPGLTVFPDFTTEEGRTTWAQWVREFAQTGFSSAWIDMNDPSTGHIQCTDMLFAKGRVPHEQYHNLYGTLMAKATRQGLEAAWPEERIFLLSRSGFTGAQQFSAHWTGDNFSNYFHLKHCIGKSINLALSGMPFNGPDVGGFGGDATEELLMDWIKACFLFPFFRNHCAQNRANQEPWMRGEQVLKVSCTFTRLRYKFLPYLYNLFIEQERNGEAILRPLIYDFEDCAPMSLGCIDTQYLIGPAIMQAPFVEKDLFERQIVLPNARWYRADTGHWFHGNRLILAQKQIDSTPIFIRDGAIVPMQKSVRRNNRNDLHDIELLLCLSSSFEGKCTCRYSVDDGITYAYNKGKRSEYSVDAWCLDKVLHVRIISEKQNAGKVRFTPVTVCDFDRLDMEIDTIKQQKTRHVYSHSSFGQRSVWYVWE